MTLKKFNPDGRLEGGQWVNLVSSLVDGVCGPAAEVVRTTNHSVVVRRIKSIIGTEIDFDEPKMCGLSRVLYLADSAMEALSAYRASMEFHHKERHLQNLAREAFEKRLQAFTVKLEAGEVGDLHRGKSVVSFVDLAPGDRFMAHEAQWTKLSHSTARKHSASSMELGDRGYGYADPICSFEPEDAVEFLPPTSRSD